jgi:hypothetical protein
MVFEAEPEEVTAKTASLPSDVLLESEILHYPVAAIAGMEAPTLEVAAGGHCTSKS